MDFKLPEIGEGVYEAEVIQWHVQPGDAVKPGQNLLEVMTDKATMEVPAPFAGTVQELYVSLGQQIKVGDRVLSYGEAKTTRPAQPEGNGRKQEATQTATVRAPRQSASPAVKAAPSVRYLARKLGIDLSHIHGSGPDGRVLIDDLSERMQRSETKPKPAAEAHPEHGTPGTRVKLIGLRRKIAERMVHAKRTIPHYSYIDECDVTDLVKIRETLREPFADAGMKLTYLAFFIKAVAAALREIPIVNASLDEQAGEIVLHDKYHIGFAVATAQGLIVPVVRDADQKDLRAVAAEIDRLSAQARGGKIRPEDLRDSTFSITSIGNIGGLISTPIVNHPNAGILGMGKIVKRPVFDAAGQVRPADIVYLSFSFDHRIVDGAVGAAFGNAVIRSLLSPARLVLA